MNGVSRQLQERAKTPFQQSLPHVEVTEVKVDKVLGSGGFTTMVLGEFDGERFACKVMR